MQIRTAFLKDAAQLLDLIQRHAAFEKAAARVTQADLAALLAHQKPPTHLIVAEDETALIGYAAVTFDYALWSASSFAHLDCLFVAESARGQGIGKQLFERAKLFAAEVWAERMEWQTPAWNLDAIRFYEREGGIGQPKMRFTKRLRSHKGEAQSR